VSSASYQVDPIGNELQNALALHGTLLHLLHQFENGARSDTTDLDRVLSLVVRNEVGWPQMEDIAYHLDTIRERLQGNLRGNLDFHLDELRSLIRDLGIWVVEKHIRPGSLAQVRQLKPELQQAGLGYLLYRHYEKERDELDGNGRGCLKTAFEYWIDWIWDGGVPVPLPLAISTTGQLIGWLAETDPDLIGASIKNVISKLERTAE
jgi:hypothetical protein